MKCIALIIFCFSFRLISAQEWVKVTKLATFNDEYGGRGVGQLQFISPSIGYYSTFEWSIGSSGGDADLYKTNNSGLNWDKIYTVYGSIGTSAYLDFHFLNEKDFCFYKGNSGSDYCKAFRDSIEIGSAFTPYPPSYGKNLNKDTIIVSDFDLKNGQYDFENGHQNISMILVNEDTIKKVPISSSYTYNYFFGGNNDNINQVCFISGFGAATGKKNNVNYFYHTNNTIEDWVADTLPDMIQPQKVYFISRNIGFIISNDTVLYRTQNTGNDWTKINFSQSFKIRDIQISNTKGYLIGNNGMLFSTLDYGETWGKETVGTANDLEHLSAINDIGFVTDSDGQLFTNNPYVSIKEEKTKQEDIKIYPNPFTNQFNIVSHEIIKSYMLFNIKGQVAKSVEEINNNSIILNLNEFPLGVYHIKINYDTHFIIKRIVKN